MDVEEFDMPTDEPFPRWIIAMIVIVVISHVLIRCT
jgi:hypothetical protein